MIVILQYVSIWSSLCIQFQKEESEQTFPREEDPVASCVPHCYTQDVSLACCLSPGAYTIVPSTYQPDCSASFTLSLARRIHRLALLLRLNLVIRWCDHTADSISFRYCYCIFVRNDNGCVFFRKVVKSQERLGRAIQEVSSLITRQHQLTNLYSTNMMSFYRMCENTT